MIIELVLVTMLLVPAVITAFESVSRMAAARQLVSDASDSASRAASLAPDPAQADTAAQQIARENLSQGGLSCLHTLGDVHVDPRAFFPGGQVTVTVTCTVDLSQVTVPGMPGRWTISASSTEPIELYRDLSGAGG